MMSTGWTRTTMLAAALALTLAGCSGGGDEAGVQQGSVDDGTTLTMWARAATEPSSSDMVKAYNASHQNQIDLTIVPDDAYQQRVGAAAGADNLPDILVSQTGYVPSYAKNGLWIDISDRIQALPFHDSLAPSHLQVSTVGDRHYGVPYLVDASLLLYNKDLFEQAGLDPEQPPRDFAEILDDARAVDALGDGVDGFYMGGNCGVCNSFTLLPYAWASGVDVFSDDGTRADFDNDAFRQVFQLYRTAWDEGLMPSNAMTEDGSTWADGFIQGRIGILPVGSFAITRLQQESDFEWGVTRLMSPDGSGTSSFVGGDVVGISKSSDNPAAAWNFIEWSLSEDAQVDIIAKSGRIPARTDLTDNEYTSADPRTKFVADTVAVGRTPFVVPLGEVMNSPNGPWLATVRGAVFGDDPDGALSQGQAQIQAGLDSGQ